MLRDLKQKLERAMPDPVAESMSPDVVAQLDDARLREAQMLGQAPGPKAMVLVEAECPEGVEPSEWRADLLKTVDHALEAGHGLPDEV